MNNHVQALLMQANALFSQGRHGPALDAYRRVLSADPRQADAWFNLGYLLRKDGQYEQALHAYGQALRMRASSPQEIHLNRAAILSDHLYRPDDAHRELQAALSLVPDYLPALLNLGNLHEERGEHDQAMSCYRHILDLHSEQVVVGARAPTRIPYDALARLAQLHKPASPDDPILRTLYQACNTGDIDDDARANLLLSLGRAYDALGLHDLAYAAFETGKLHAHRKVPAYDRPKTQQRTDALIAAFPHPAPRREDCSGKAPAPVFICGMFRSGSTLLEQVLATHSAIVPGGELDILPRMVARELAPFPASMGTFGADKIASLAHAYRTRLHSMLPESSRQCAYVTDKRPDNYLLVGLIKHLFPDARIIHTRRNPLDNALSVFMHHLNPRAFAYAGRLADIGHHYGEYRRLMSHWISLYPDDIHDFDYDDFVAAPRATLEPLLEFLDIQWNDGFLQFHRQSNAVRTASYWQVRRPLYGNASGRWRNYEPHLSALFDSLTEAGVDLPR